MERETLFEMQADLNERLGRIASEAERLHHMLYIITSHILMLRGLDREATKLMLAEMQVDGLRQCWRKLMNLQFPDFKDHIRRLDTSIQAAQKARNGTVHVLWDYEPGEGVGTFVGRSRRDRDGTKTIAELDSALGTVNHAHSLLHHLYIHTTFVPTAFENIFELDDKDGLRIRGSRIANAFVPVPSTP